MTLQETSLHFNSNIKVSHTGGHLSSDAGLILIQEFLNQLQFREMLDPLVFHDTRQYQIHQNADMLYQLILQRIAGYPAMRAANVLATDDLFQLLNAHTMTTQPSISRLLDRVTPQTLQGLRQINQTLIDYGRQATNQQAVILDVDSTHFDTFGHQEGAAYNAHYQTNGYHPLVAFDSTNEDLIDAQLRPGNTYTSTGAVDFLRPVIQHYQDSLPTTELLIRGDSGFATPELYQLCEQADVQYVIRLKSNPRFVKEADQRVLYDDDCWDQLRTEYYELTYRASSWTHSRRVCIEARLIPGKLLYEYTFIVTNLSNRISAATVFKIYRRRGNMENFIKEAKQGFAIDKTDSSTMVKNEFSLLIGVLAYNLVNLMRRLTFPKAQQTYRIATIRNYLLKVAGKVVKTARQIHLKLSSTQVYQSLFDRILVNIQALT